MKKLFLLLFTLLLTGSAFSQAPLKPAQLVQHHKDLNGRFAPVTNLLVTQQISVNARPDLASEISKGVLLSLNQEKAQLMGREAPRTLTLTLPKDANTNMQVELVQVDIFSPEFRVSTSEGQTLTPELGTHYRGVIKGVPGSLASVSVFEDQVIGMFSSPNEGNIVLGPLNGNNPNHDHIIYNDADLLLPATWECHTEDDGEHYTPDQLAPATKALTDCIRIYYEVDYDVYSNKGAGTTAFITAEFNEIATLYANESLNYLLNEVYINTTAGSAYTNGSSSSLLSQFKSRISTINGANLGHLVTYRSSGGIAAGFSGLCNSNVDNSLCISDINGTYSTVPTYSWDIMVQTHEMGHLNGSRHTHACVWNGNNTAIDGCAGSTEGGCALPGYPSGGGTMMSYCHIQSVGINFSNGFGPQPGNVIRNATTNASCLQACGGGGGGGPTCGTTISSFPYTEGFESGLGAWSQDSGDNFDWTRDSGGTPSSGTGPTSGNGGSTWYVYAESSSPNYPSKTAILNGPCLDLSGQSACTMDFAYHMYGAAMGTLELQTRPDGSSTWTTQWTLSGDQGNTWNNASVNLNSFAGSTIQVRFRGTTSSSFTSDFTVDDISITTSGGGGGACTGGIASFPYSESFESGFGAWNQAGPDDFDWSRNSGGTPSSNTGPTAASDGSWYLYVEASSPNYSNKSTYLVSNCFDLSAASQATFTFDYHMYGAAGMGGLTLSVSKDNGVT